MLKNYSDQDLQNEIEHRKREKEKLALERPTLIPKNKINLDGLINTCESVLDDMEQNRAHEDDPHYIFESAMETLYGKDIWKWWNKNT